MTNPLLRTLISEMVETYLEESYNDDLIESIFNEVSDETWEAIEEAIMNELSEETYDLYIEGSLKKGSPERRMKDLYRRGEAKTRDFYSGRKTALKLKAPQNAAERRAQEAGEKAGDGSPTAKGSARSAPQDMLNKPHDQSNVTPTSKSFRSTHSQKMYGIAKSKPNLPK